MINYLFQYIYFISILYIYYIIDYKFKIKNNLYKNNI